VPYLERAAHPAAARRQDLAPLFVPCGAIYIYGRAYFRQPGADRRAAWVELPWPETLDIDSPDDLETARALYSARSGGC
jgi:CMP-N-acetylneuraminic acid synthetase